MNYTNLDIALIIANCKSLVELINSCKAMRYLYEIGESINLDFALFMAEKREQALIQNINRNIG